MKTTNKFNQNKQMKTTTKLIKLIMAIAIVLLIINPIKAQSTGGKTKIAVLSIDYKGDAASPILLGNYLRTELAKLDQFEVMDRYDEDFILNKKNMKPDNCYGKLCLVEFGNALGVDKMMTGSVDPYGDTFILTLNLIDVKTSTIEKTFVKEFLNLPKEFPTIISVSVHEMYGMPNDAETLKRLTKKFNQESSVNNPHEQRLNLNGPRFGCVAIIGSDRKIIMSSKANGGFDAFPLMFQFGYQYEQQYLNQGKLQALFEFIPMMTGLEQGMFIPSFTILHGLRNSSNGFEFAFGPSLRLVKEAQGFYASDGDWHLSNEWNNYHSDIPAVTQSRLDSRGSVKLDASFVFALGFTMKSGDLNIPINAYVVPGKDSFRVGASFGFNGKAKK